MKEFDFPPNPQSQKLKQRKNLYRKLFIDRNFILKRKKKRESKTYIDFGESEKPE